MEYEDVVRTVVELFKKAHTELPDDVVEALKKAYEREENEVARSNLEAILKNIEASKSLKVPMCQDTGLPIVFVEIGREISLDFDLKRAM